VVCIDERKKAQQKLETRETAEALGISLSAAKGRLFHAKNALRKSAPGRAADQPRFAGKFMGLAPGLLGTDTQTWFHRSEQSSQRRREMRMSSKSKEHQNVESQVTSAPQGEAVNISAPDSPHLEAIRIRAYEIYIERGGQPGHDLDDWLQGERELEPKVRAANEGQ